MEEPEEASLQDRYSEVRARNSGKMALINEQKVLTCPQCPQKFTMRQYLKSHVTKLHPSFVMCELCKVYFKEDQEHSCHEEPKVEQSKIVLLL